MHGVAERKKVIINRFQVHQSGNIVKLPNIHVPSFILRWIYKSCPFLISIWSFERSIDCANLRDFTYFLLMITNGAVTIMTHWEKTNIYFQRRIFFIHLMGRKNISNLLSHWIYNLVYRKRNTFFLSYFVLKQYVFNSVYAKKHKNTLSQSKDNWRCCRQEAKEHKYNNYDNKQPSSDSPHFF